MPKYFIIIFFILVTLAIFSVFIIISQRNDIFLEPELVIFEDKELNFDLSEPEQEKDSLKIVKAIYVTSWSISRKDYIDNIINIAKNTEVNSVVIDIKDWSGYVAYDSAVPEVEKYNAKSIRIKDINSVVKRLHEEDIYLIARISIFQDPVLAIARPDLAIHSKASPVSLWLDNSGLAWIDPAAKESWDYNIAIAKEIIGLGFDEINFDYIRFPSDGNLKDMSFPLWDKSLSKHLVIKEFFQYLRQELPEAKLSVDLFGLSTISFDDLGIGQIIEDAFEYFDYICPMVYPSHYAVGFLGYQNPADYPYEVVRHSIDTASERLFLFSQLKETKAQLRPWLQDFNLGAIYDAKMVKLQIQAVYDSTKEDFNGFMLWNSSNIYSEDALLPAK